jgi:hypothetical protein
VESGRIKATLGYEKGKIIIPKNSLLPFFCFRVHAQIASGTFTIDQITVKRIDGLSERDAHDLGFENLQKMRFAMWRTFGEVGPSEIVTVMSISDFVVNWEND